VAEELERVVERQVPPKLDPLPEDDADAARELDSLADRFEPGHAHLPGGRDENPRQHLHRRRLAGTVGAHVPDDRAALDFERDAVDGGDGAPRTPQAAALHADDELLPHVADVDHPPALR
jgi:hypothetical protein